MRFDFVMKKKNSQTKFRKRMPKWFEQLIMFISTNNVWQHGAKENNYCNFASFNRLV